MPSAHLAADAWVAVALAQPVLPLVLHQAGVGHGEGAAIVGCNVWAGGVLLRDSMPDMNVCVTIITATGPRRY